MGILLPSVRGGSATGAGDAVVPSAVVVAPLLAGVDSMTGISTQMRLVRAVADAP